MDGWNSEIQIHIHPILWKWQKIQYWFILQVTFDMHFRSEAKHSTIQKTLANRKTQHKLNGKHNGNWIQHKGNRGGKSCKKSHKKLTKHSRSVFGEAITRQASQRSDKITLNSDEQTCIYSIIWIMWLKHTLFWILFLPDNTDESSLFFKSASVWSFACFGFSPFCSYSIKLLSSQKHFCCFLWDSNLFYFYLV